jgi:hypothetical protein
VETQKSLKPTGMKKISLIATCLCYIITCSAQQTLTMLLQQNSTVKTTDEKGVERTSIKWEPPKTLKLYGIGNLNSETLNKINSSGKIAVSIVPHYNVEKQRFFEVYLSFNKNATNSNSILASTVLFPEVGNHSFLATIRRVYAIKGKNNRLINEGHYFAPFLEFSQKNIKVDTSSKQGKSTSGFFSTLTYTFGYSYIFNRVIEKTSVAFSVSPYISALNIPDEDNDDYRKIFDNPKLPSTLLSFGIKTVFQIKEFQIFADMRHLWGSDTKVPRDLRGFNSNIGVTFNADIFEL